MLGSPLFAALVPIAVLAGAWQLARSIFALVRRYRQRRDLTILTADRQMQQCARAMGFTVGA